MAKILVADDEVDLELLIKQKFRKNPGEYLRVHICPERHRSPSLWRYG